MLGNQVGIINKEIWVVNQYGHNMRYDTRYDIRAIDR